MRTLTTLVSMCLLAPSAFADGTKATTTTTTQAPAPGHGPYGVPVAPTTATARISLAPIDLATTPERCKPIVKRAAAGSLTVALSARISLAGCLADSNIASLQLIDSGESVVAVEQAAAPAFALLDEVIAAGDPATQVVAQHAKAELYGSMTTKMIATIPSATTSTPEAIALRDSRRALLDSMLTPWRERARDAHLAVDKLAKDHRELATNPVAVAAVRDSRQQLAATAVATAEQAPAQPDPGTEPNQPAHDDSAPANR